MTKNRKKQVNQMIKTIARGHEAVKKAIEIKNYDMALELLQQCQEGAIQLGNAIEKAEGERFKTIPLLEDYCEVVYQVYEEITRESQPGAGKLYKKLYSSFLSIENSVRNDIPARFEAVFLPYKASMWDSLESVWKAADADPNCDAYVVPIPYYDKKPDGSVKEFHYEGDQYPAYVPVIGYEEYDIEGRRPDVIFIHNPYDNANFVTTVPPAFYAENLRNYTDKLVYIPYFVLQEISPDNKEAIKNIAHFCTVPGVIYAHKVIVQSQDMRTIYINVLTEAYGENSRKLWEEKILGLGSPKMDRVQSIRKEDVEIPRQWLAIIQKPDGSRKKVVLYNTSINALLKQEEKMLVKICDVLRIFQEHCEDIALLWRPHPLIEATIASMRPRLWDAYKKIVDQYRKDGWGIYDDTADLNRAIALADAYYGDGSSVVQLCQNAGMPVMIQNAEIITADVEKSYE